MLNAFFQGALFALGFVLTLTLVFLVGIKPLRRYLSAVASDRSEPNSPPMDEFGSWLRQNGLRASNGNPAIEEQWQDFMTYDGRPR